MFFVNNLNFYICVLFFRKTKFDSMLIVISPAKALDFKTPPVTEQFTVPEMLEKSEKLIAELKKMDREEISKLMGISTSLGELNFQRFQTWHLPFNAENAKQAVLAFNGEVFRGLDADRFSANEFETAQKRLRILSGLYGVLKPLDLIQPYRLEMGTKLKTDGFSDLYGFWKSAIVAKINKAVEESGSGVLVNLASAEYFKSIDKQKLKAKVITPEFKDLKNGKYKIISIYAKKARGLMTRFIIENNITDADSLPAFDVGGYNFNPRLSKPLNPVFTRDK